MISSKEYEVKVGEEVVGLVFPNQTPIIANAMFDGVCISGKECATNEEAIAWIEEQRLQRIEVQHRTYQFMRRLCFIDGFNEKDKPDNPAKCGPPHSHNWFWAVSFLNAWLAGQRYGIEQNKNQDVLAMLKDRCVTGKGFPLDDEVC